MIHETNCVILYVPVKETIYVPTVVLKHATQIIKIMNPLRFNSANDDQVCNVFIHVYMLADCCSSLEHLRVMRILDPFRTASIQLRCETMQP